MTYIHQKDPEHAWKAKARMIKGLDGNLYMGKELDSHTHDVNKASIIATMFGLEIVAVVDDNNHVERADAFIIEVPEEMRTTITSCLTEGEEDTWLEEKHFVF